MDPSTAGPEDRQRSRGARGLLQVIARLPPWGRDLLLTIRGLRQHGSTGGRRAIVQVLRDLIRIVEAEYGDEELGAPEAAPAQQ